MIKIKYSKGQLMNCHNITYVSDIKKELSSKSKKRKSLFKCNCGNNFISSISDVKQNKRKSCGCKKGNTPNKYTYGDLINGIKFIKTLGTINYAQKAIFECPKCKKEWKSLIANIQQGNTKSCCDKKRGWSRSQWINKSKKSYLYKVRLFNDNESFIKIGITINTIKKRISYIPYNYDILKIIEGESGYIYDLENKTKRLFKKNKYKPLISFKGETECYKDLK
jgi:hypothetical protein